MEAFVPSTGHYCYLPDLPGDERHYHTMEEMTVCGGYNTTDTGDSTSTSCLSLIDGTWQTTTTLLEKRLIVLIDDPHYHFSSLVPDICPNNHSPVIHITRYSHVSWASPSGLRMLGGHRSRWTSERIQEDETSVSGFPLNYAL